MRKVSALVKERDKTHDYSFFSESLFETTSSNDCISDVSALTSTLSVMPSQFLARKIAIVAFFSDRRNIFLRNEAFPFAMCFLWIHAKLSPYSAMHHLWIVSCEHEKKSAKSSIVHCKSHNFSNTSLSISFFGLPVIFFPVSTSVNCSPLSFCLFSCGVDLASLSPLITALYFSYWHILSSLSLLYQTIQLNANFG